MAAVPPPPPVPWGLPGSAAAAAADPPRKLLVTVVSGLPGAGKSSLTRHVLGNKEGFRLAILANDAEAAAPPTAVDAADAALPAAAFSASSSAHASSSSAPAAPAAAPAPAPAPAVVSREEGAGGGLVRLRGGCVCCTRRVDFAVEVLRFAKSGLYDYLLVEASGEAEPRQLAELFRPDAPPEDNSEGGFVRANGRGADRKRRSLAESLRELAELDTMITVVDGSSIMQVLSREAGPGDTELAQLLIRQVEFADMVVVNKCGLLPAAAQGDVKQLLGLLNPEAGVLFAEGSQVPVYEVLGRGEYMWQELKHQQPVRRWLEKGHRGFNGLASAFSSNACASACCAPPPSAAAPPPAEAASSGGDGGVGAEAGFMCFSFRPGRPFHPARMARLLDGSTALPAGLLRVSGTVWIASRPLQRGVWSAAGGAAQLAPGPEWWVLVPQKQWPESVAPLLDSLGLLHGQERRWVDPENGDCHTEVEVVCSRECRALVEASLSELLLTPAEFSLGPAAWASLDEGGLPAWGARPSEDALSSLASCGAEGMLEALCALRADPNARNRLNGGTALHMASMKGRERSVQALIQARADCSAAAAARGLAPMHLASSPAVVELLLAGGADLEARDGNGYTALHHAAEMGKREVLATLLEKRAEANAATRLGASPLQLASAAGAEEAARLLVAACAR